MTLSNDFKDPANSPVIALKDFLTIFHLDSTLYRHALGDSTKIHPGIDRSVAAMSNFHMDAEDINHSGSIMERISSRQTSLGHSITYGEYSRPLFTRPHELPEKRVFLTMIHSIPHPDLSPEDAAKFEDPFSHTLHVSLHGRIESLFGQESLRPFEMCIGLGANRKNTLDFGSLQTSAEFQRGLCYADAAMCQIMSEQPLTPNINARWVTKEPMQNVIQKIEWMKTRSPQDLASLTNTRVYQPPALPSLVPRKDS